MTRTNIKTRTYKMSIYVCLFGTTVVNKLYAISFHHTIINKAYSKFQQWQ